PERFDIARTPNDHVAFGIGPHFCLGANLARLEIQVMFEELLRRLPDIELAAPAQRLRSYFINGIKRMPIRFSPQAPRDWPAGPLGGARARGRRAGPATRRSARRRRRSP